jgi:hypothetical protein
LRSLFVNGSQGRFCLELTPCISLKKQHYAAYIKMPAISVKRVDGCVSKLSGCMPQIVTVEVSFSGVWCYMIHTSNIFLSTVTPCLHLVSTTCVFPHVPRSQNAICDFMYGKSLILVGLCRLLLPCQKIDYSNAEALMASDNNFLASINFTVVFLSMQHNKFASYISYHLTGRINIYMFL